MKTINKFCKVYNHTFEGKKKVFFPKNTLDILQLFTKFKKKKIQPLLHSGGCGHGDKSFLSKNNLVVSLENFNKIIDVNYKKNTLTAQSGVKIYDLFKFLQKKNYFIYNVPGGKNVSLAGAVAGNVHGRPQSQNYSTFGDNIIFIKYLDNQLKLKTIYNNNKKFRYTVGSLGKTGLITEVCLKIFPVTQKNFKKIDTTISNYKEYLKFDKSYKSYYGYINLFEKNKFEANFTHFEENTNPNYNKNKNFNYFALLNFFKLDYLISYFINNFFLRIFYYIIFKINLVFKKTKSKISSVSFENSVYFVNINTFLPYYFRMGMIEIQFSLSKKNLFNIINKVKEIHSREKVYPFFFILKKMKVCKKKYILNFPKYPYCISLGYSKKQIEINSKFLINLYKILYFYKCNLYFTKDETFLNNKNPYREQVKFLKKNKTCFTNDFYEKIEKL